MDTAPNVATLPPDSQSNSASNVEEILAMIGTLSLSPGDVQRLTTTIHKRVDPSGNTDSEDDCSSVSEEASSQVLVPIVTTTASAPSLTMPPMPPIPAPVVTDDPAVVQEAANPIPILPVVPAVLIAHPVAPVIPAEHFTTSHHGVLFLLPLQNLPGPYYLITKGRSVGVIADWSCASPLVTGVKGAVFHKVLSVGLGLQSMLSAINNGTVEYL
ncbi:hypothetical protein JVT61DRAFT_10050 [Boletus reticuloceps]|uniref:Uncharacterized protein n=1 Tax=Boletus reticuloceps TaxID=495285 RepID=A0A8I3AEL4_9AGAM|nr:hypothetical protein JVT61DRAFT_10050 [Boletus reticuloceps]